MTAKPGISRRKAIQTAAMGTMAAFSHLSFGSPWKGKNKSNAGETGLPMRISLNTSTLMAYQLPVDQQIALVAEAGFEGVELWMRDIVAYLDAGGDTGTLRGMLESRKLLLENIIGFSSWCSDDEEARKKAAIQMAEEMQITAQLGGAYIAAPVMGPEALDPAKFDTYAERYNHILELGDEHGVVPILEIWGMGALHRLDDCAKIVLATGHPKATMLLDFYHLYRGGSDWDSLSVLNGARLPVIHMNDYPDSPSREELTDGHRLLPGEGICPYDKIIPMLYEAGFRGGLSVELFNKGYWERMDAASMLSNSYESTFKVLKNALATTR